MPQWSGFLARLIQFAMEELQALTPIHADAKRKEVAIALLKAHEALILQEDQVHRFVESCVPFMSGEKPRLYREAFRSLEHDSWIATRSMERALRQLHQALMANGLAASLVFFGVRKDGEFSRFLEIMKFALVPTDDAVFAFEYTAPTPELLNVDLKKALSGILETNPWPDVKTAIVHSMKYSRTDFLLDMADKGHLQGEVQAHRKDQVAFLFASVKEQVSTIIRTREDLGHLLRENFELSDLLLPVASFRFTI